jgi:hypothetical protein
MSEFAEAMARARRRSSGDMTEAAAAAVAKSTPTPTKTPAAATKPTPTLTKTTWSQQHMVKTPTKPTPTTKEKGETKTPTKTPSKTGATTLNAAYAAKFEALTQLSIVEQAQAFLMQFVMEFRGRFNEVTDMALEFQGFAGPMAKGEHVQELDEFQCHQFLEKRGETLTVSDLRDKLRDIDIDSNGMVAFLEYLLFVS